MNQYNHCAVLVKSGSVLTIAKSGRKAGRLVDKIYDLCGFHAECAALCALDEETIRNSVLYIAGWSRGGNIINSKPCEKCQKYLNKFELKGIYYGTAEGKVKKYG